MTIVIIIKYITVKYHLFLFYFSVYFRSLFFDWMHFGTFFIILFLLESVQIRCYFLMNCSIIFDYHFKTLKPQLFIWVVPFVWFDMLYNKVCRIRYTIVYTINVYKVPPVYSTNRFQFRSSFRLKNLVQSLNDKDKWKT